MSQCSSAGRGVTMVSVVTGSHGSEVRASAPPCIYHPTGSPPPSTMCPPEPASASLRCTGRPVERDSAALLKWAPVRRLSGKHGDYGLSYIMKLLYLIFLKKINNLIRLLLRKTTLQLVIPLWNVCSVSEYLFLFWSAWFRPLPT